MADRTQPYQLGLGGDSAKPLNGNYRDGYTHVYTLPLSFLCSLTTLEPSWTPVDLGQHLNTNVLNMKVASKSLRGFPLIDTLVEIKLIQLVCVVPLKTNIHRETCKHTITSISLSLPYPIWTHCSQWWPGLTVGPWLLIETMWCPHVQFASV